MNELNGEDLWGGVEIDIWPEPVEGNVLLEEMASVLRRYVVLPKHGAEALALWAVHTYAFQLREVSCYVGVESPEKRCGKTTLLSVMGELVHRPVAAANISSSAFYRVIEESRPTLLIDEADTFLHGNDELRGVLNAGYSRKTAFVVRVSQKQRMEDGGLRIVLPDRHQTESSTRTTTRTRTRTREARLARFSCWCPKMMAAIGRLPETLADRCIVIRMQRKTTREVCERLRDLEVGALRRKCARWVRDHATEIAGARPELPQELNDRAADIWEPLLALADLAGGDWPVKAREAAVGLSGSGQERSPIGALLLDILSMFTCGKQEKYFSRKVVDHLNILDARPWMDLCRGSQVTESWLANQLRPFGVYPRNIFLQGKQAKGYRRKDFTEAFRRYIPQADLQAHNLEGKVEVAQST